MLFTGGFLATHQVFLSPRCQVPKAGKWMCLSQRHHLPGTHNGALRVELHHPWQANGFQGFAPPKMIKDGFPFGFPSNQPRPSPPRHAVGQGQEGRAAHLPRGRQQHRPEGVLPGAGCSVLGGLRVCGGSPNLVPSRSVFLGFLLYLVTHL